MTPFEDSGEVWRIVLAIALSSIVVALSSVLWGGPFQSVPSNSSSEPTHRQTYTDVDTPKTNKLSQEENPFESGVFGSLPTTQSEIKYNLDTDRLVVIFDDEGNVVSLKLKGQKDGNDLVDLVRSNGEPLQGLRIAFDIDKSTTVRGSWQARTINSTTIEFSRECSHADNTGPSTYLIKKTYFFKNGEYFFTVKLGIENVSRPTVAFSQLQIPFHFDEGPQIGPAAIPLEGTSGSDYRKYVSFTEGKKRGINVAEDGSVKDLTHPTWVALVGKYFTFIAIPDSKHRDVQIQSKKDKVITRVDKVRINGTISEGGPQIYGFYFGPKTSNELGRYTYSDKNGFGLSDLSLDSAVDRSDILGWLEGALLASFKFFHGVVPNYGWAIILLTLLVKSALFPVAKNAAKTSQRMQDLQPKLLKLQERYKADRQKLSLKISELYHDEGINPLSSFFPILLQLPIFIALYNVFNNSFDLRGAVFIPGWITDLSLPDSIVSFPPVDLLVWKISAIRGLPIIYLFSQFLYGKYTQVSAPQGQGSDQAKFMLYGIPLIFFFVLYDVPSGLVVYWTTSNLISLVQQVLILWLIRRKPYKPGVKKSREGKRKLFHA